MKKLNLILVLILTSVIMFAQTPESFKYQAVYRDATGNIIANQNISVQIRILEGSESGSEVFTETHNTSTNNFGLFNLEVGTVNTSDFPNINWGVNSYFVNTFINGTDFGTSQLLSVPYALHAKTADNITGGVTEIDPIFIASPANSITNVDITNWDNKLDAEIDGSITNEIQNLSFNDNTISISNGNSVDLPYSQELTMLDVCDASNEGKIRYNTTLQNTEFCNGTNWEAMGNIDCIIPDTIFFENFESTIENASVNLSNWLNSTEAGTVEWIGKLYNSNKYAQFSPYNSGEESNIGWLITPSVDFDSKESERLSFDYKIGYWTNHGLQVLISTDFDGSDIASATWQDISISFKDIPTSGYDTDFTHIGDIDLSNIQGTGYIAFKYVGSGNNNQTTAYQIDNVLITEGGGSLNDEKISVFQVNGSNLEIIEGGATHTVALSNLSDSDWLTNGDNLYNSNSGNVGIGTSSPTSKLFVASVNSVDASSTGIKIDLTNTTGDVGGFVVGTDSRSTANGVSLNRGLQAVAKSNDCTAQGVIGFAVYQNSGNNYAIYGVADSSSAGNYGICGSAKSDQGGDNVGVYGSATGAGAGENYGVYGYALNSTTNNYAGYFEGDVTITGNLDITGNLSKAGGTFKIDYPTDPANKYLIHSFVESPDMMNIFNGNIITDINGYATVELPEYFEESNKDFRYQLTVIGDFSQAIIKDKIENNKFVIQTNNPNIEVSWQITGIRNDEWAKENRVVPVVEKEEKGTYLHPELFGMPKEKSINHKHNKISKTKNEAVLLEK